MKAYSTLSEERDAQHISVLLSRSIDRHTREEDNAISREACLQPGFEATSIRSTPCSPFIHSKDSRDEVRGRSRITLHLDCTRETERTYCREENSQLRAYRFSHLFAVRIGSETLGKCGIVGREF